MKKLKTIGSDLSSRKHQDITAKDARDRTRRTKHRDDRIWRHQHFSQSRGKTTQQIKDKVTDMAEQVFDIVAKYPEKQHVSADMGPSAMHEH